VGRYGATEVAFVIDIATLAFFHQSYISLRSHDAGRLAHGLAFYRDHLY